jgi:putative flippase GtrA
LTGKLIRFLAGGLPGFVAAAGLNWLLVSTGEWPKPLAYAVVLWVQFTLNFYVCFYWVFERKTLRPSWAQYWKLLSGVAVMRGADWAVYTALTEFTGLPYLGIQLFNVVLFALLRFKYATSVFEKRAEEGGTISKR